MNTQPTTLQSRFVTDKSLLYKGLLTVFGSILVALSAHIVVPLYPVPITLQSFAVLFLAMSLGWRLGVGIVGLYLLENLCGFSVFAAEGALNLNLGYILGFILAAGISGYLVERGWGQNKSGVIAAALIGTLAIYIVGLPVLAAYVGWHSALTLGVLPFLLGDIIKIAALALIIPAFWQKPTHR